MGVEAVKNLISASSDFFMFMIIFADKPNLSWVKYYQKILLFSKIAEDVLLDTFPESEFLGKFVYWKLK